MKLTDIKPNPSNPRIIKDEKFFSLVKSIKDFPKMMELRPIVVDDSMMVLGGNMRLKALKEAGYTEIPEEWVKKAKDLTEDQKKEFIIKDNVGFGEWDYQDLQANWDTEKLEEWGLDIPSEFTIEPEAHEDDYEIPDHIETDIVLGDLFEIGEHRLLCGSSTEADAVAKLLNKKEPYLMVTDPPYGVEYNAEWRDDRGLNGRGKGTAKGKVMNDDRADWTYSWALSPSKVAYIWSSDRFAYQTVAPLIASNFEVRNQIIWAKSQIVISRGNYHPQHEPCWYAVKKGNVGNWAGDHKQSTVWFIDKPRKSETGHSTQKPIECMARPIQNHDGDVYDPFIGSGTTMVAAHQLKRKCYGMELDPKYCQVIVDRMMKLDPTLEVKRNGVKYAKNSVITA